MNYKTRNWEFYVLRYGVLSNLLFLRVEYTINHAKNKKCLFTLKPTLKNAQVLKFWSCSVTIYYFTVTVMYTHVRWQCLLRTLSLLSSRVGPMTRSQIQARRLPTKVNNTSYSSKLSSKKSFQFMAYVFGETVISYCTSWIVMYKAWSN
jgi:hypothetical protein